MNSITEKEKKLNQTLEKLKNLDLTKKDNSTELENFKQQKNQLEIEYKQLLVNYNFLEKERASAFARILGYVITDGCLFYNKSKKVYVSYIYIFHKYTQLYIICYNL